jgi:hypothetical protein
MANRCTKRRGDRLPPDKAELAQIIRCAYDEIESPDESARAGNAVRAALRARPEMTAPDALATVPWVLREPTL